MTLCKFNSHICRRATNPLHRRNVVNVLLFVAETCRRYFPASDIPEMLSTFMPIVTQDVSRVFFTYSPELTVSPLHRTF